MIKKLKNFLKEAPCIHNYYKIKQQKKEFYRNDLSIQSLFSLSTLYYRGANSLLKNINNWLHSNQRVTGRNLLAKCMRINSDTRKMSTYCQRALKKSLELFIEILNSKEILAIFSVNMAGETALILSKMLVLYALCVPSTQLFGVKC